MTAAVASNDYSSFFVNPRSTGASQTAQHLQHIIKRATNDLTQPLTWRLRIEEAQNALIEAYERCAKENWDGYGASPIPSSAITEGLVFLEALPSWIPIPEIVPEPDGSIGFEWYGGKDWVFVASLSGQNIITYAGLLGIHNKSHGTSIFNDSIPPIVIENIRKVIP